MNLNNYKNLTNQQGLTLIETTIGLGILMVGIMASLTVMFSSFQYSQQAEYEIVVVNLAREGIEIVRSMRNNEDDNDPTDFDIFTLTEDSNYDFDIEDDNVADTLMENNLINTEYNITAADCNICSLYFKDGKYVHDSNGSTPTIYNRLIKIEEVDTQPNVKRVISEVSWNIKNKTYSYTLETYLYDWQ